MDRDYSFLNRLGIHPSWHIHLGPLFSTEHMKNLPKQLGNNFHPERHLIFRAFSQPFDEVKVVIIGQDPYPSDIATGVAFAVRENTKIPMSLDVIFRELKKEYKLENQDPHIDKTLSHWRNQGVLLLNTALTVEPGKPNSHSALWRPFIQSLVAKMSFDLNPVWVLLGKNARDLKNKIIYKENEDFKIIERHHPAAERYGNEFKGFFSDVNKYVPINWI